MAWIDRTPKPEMWGVEAGWFLYTGGMPDPVGRKILREVLQPKRPEWELFEHECFWGEPARQSTSCRVPPPRAVCCHGFVAAV